MSEIPETGSVTYEEVDDAYFDKRGLRRYAGIWSLWALGVGAVISGDFFGWNFGLAVGGFGGLLIATIIIAVMYTGMCYSIAEMSPALPHTGGAYSFGRTAMGPWGGFITGLAENIEYVLTPAVIVVGIGGYLNGIGQDLLGVDIPPPVLWAATYAIFVGLNIIGVELTFKFSVFITFLALGILMVFWAGAVGHFDMDAALNIPADDGQSSFLPKGLSGITAALPFAIWFYLAIEQLPLAAEEAHDPKRDMPRGILYGLITLIIASLLTLFLNSGVGAGAQVMGTTDKPLLLGFEAIFGDGVGTSLLGLLAVAGLIASFHTIIYAYGRNIYSLSRAGYFPRWLSVTHESRKTPHVALIAGAVQGFLIALLIQYGEDIFGSKQVGAVLLNMAVFGAVIAYIMQMIAFVRLRKILPDIERPYVSPLGNAGAVLALIIAAVTLVFLFLNADYRIGVIGCAIWFVAGIAYFGLVGRHHLVFSPEEAFAASGGASDRLSDRPSDRASDQLSDRAD